jgi:hypothetical protein
MHIGFLQDDKVAGASVYSPLRPKSRMSGANNHTTYAPSWRRRGKLVTFLLMFLKTVEEINILKKL